MYIITQKGKSCHYCSKLVWLSSVEYISPLFFSFTFSLRCRGPMTAVWSVRCLQRHRATSTMTSSSILCARCQEELHWLIGKCLGDSYCSFSDYILIQQFLYMWCVYIFFVRGYYVRWKAVDHCMNQFFHATNSSSRRQVGWNIHVLCL